MTETKLHIHNFRLFVSCFYRKEHLPSDISQFIRSYIAMDMRNKPKHFRLVHLGDFSYGAFDSLGSLEIDLGTVDTGNEPKPSDPFLLSKEIKNALEKINEDSAEFRFDTFSLYPYAVIHANALQGHPDILWTTETIREHKRVIGPWIEYYSGQWDDYSEELYDSRIQGNLSNRLSELHFIRANSAFIFMPTTDPGWETFMDYMEKNFITPIILSKAIVFALMTINEELDGLAERISETKGQIPLAKIEEELEFIEQMKLSVSIISTRLDREKLMNRLQHATAVIKECFRIFSLNEANATINRKVETLRETLQALQEKTKLKLQAQQKKWVLILNALIGSQVLFTIRDNIVGLDIVQQKGWANTISVLTWLLFGILVITSLVGLAISYLRRTREI